MTTEIVVTKSFEERMMDMMRENVGTLFTPDDLKKIVEKGIEKLYFEPRLITSSYGRNEYKNSLSEELVEKHIQSQVREAVGKWVIDNPEILKEFIDKALQEGMSKRIVRAIDEMFQQTFFQFGESIKNQILNVPR